jgi:hypothetical protein
VEVLEAASDDEELAALLSMVHRIFNLATNQQKGQVVLLAGMTEPLQNEYPYTGLHRMHPTANDLASGNALAPTRPARTSRWRGVLVNVSRSQSFSTLRIPCCENGILLAQVHLMTAKRTVAKPAA